MKTYEIWSEGFHVNEGLSPAHFYGIQQAESFKEACILVARKHPGFAHNFDADRMTHWGCQLFDNEHDARQSFG